jgi:enterochelin esterase-like enzyme
MAKPPVKWVGLIYHSGMRISAVLLLCSGAAWAQPSPPKAFRSPEIGPDRRVTFRLLAPNAAAVTLSGEFLEGSRPLQKDSQGVWSLTVGPIDPEIYNYTFMIDGVKTIDPANPAVKTGSTPSTIASILEVTGDRPAFYDPQGVPHGEIRTHWYPSKSLNSVRRLTVYTPPGYDKDRQARYPVLYLFHGANADEAAWTRLGRVNLILDNLLAAGKAKPFLVVMPFGYGVTPGSGQTGDNMALFSRDLLEDAIPFVETQYRVYTDRDRRAIAGLSMGGGQSLGIGLAHPELFSYVAGFSAALRPPEFAKTFAGIAADPQATNKKLHLLWIGCGNQDSLFANSKAFSQFLEERKIKHVFRESPGAHTWIVWRRYLNEVAPLLFQ